MEKTLGISKNTAAALSYVLTFVTGIFFFLVSKDPYVRFHALQSIVVFAVLIALQWIFAVTVILASLSSLVGLLSFILWLLLIYKAWSGEEWEVPVLGEFVRKLVKK